MPKFLLVHSIGKEFSVEGGTPIAKAIKAACTTDAYWIRSWYAREEGKLYCEWDAKDPGSIREVMEKSGAEMPIDGIYKMDLLINSEDFRQFAGKI